ncbi:hypothetical protein BT96DRAFT_986324 [Gymnopus androsaceus JB14]|uniref:BTB domain-containing protein n=1 Tax=Gymnopus androsaceus JB14 TaxID=1447944 RepID=A0A6A4IAM4_9AGAR|nr:hypothetical protein BT96DRAFT_986324 [Gymnopus androsaceus JB14]
MARALSHNSHTKNRSLDMSDSSKAEGPVRVSEIFNSPDADVVVRSADNIDFRLHKKNLECSTGSFPPADTPVDPKETVHLTESGETLEILFHAIYPRPFPEERMKELEFKSFMLLAEAAEKYAVYSMISCVEVLYPTCTLTIEVTAWQLDGYKHALSPKRLRILEFAVNHNHRDLIYEAAVTLG